MKKTIALLLLSAIMLNFSSCMKMELDDEDSLFNKAFKINLEEDSGYGKKTIPNVKIEEEKQEESSKNTVIEYTYEENIDVPIEEIDGVKCLPYTADEFIELINEKSQENLKNPSTFTRGKKKEFEITVDSDVGIVCILKVVGDTERVSEIEIYSPKGSFSNSEIAQNDSLINMNIISIPILMAVDPNMTPNYAGMKILDIYLSTYISDDRKVAIISEEYQIGKMTYQIDKGINGAHIYIKIA